MGFLDENTLTWGADSISRVTTNNGGIQLKADLQWSNNALYIASGYDSIDGCGPSSAPTFMPTVEPTKTPTLVPSFEPTKTPTSDTQTSCDTANPGAIHVTDTSPVGRQWYPIVEKLADGRLVVAWDDLGTNDNMFRIYSSSLTPLTGPIAFNRGLTMQSSWGWQARESVRALPSGGFVMLVSGADIGATFANGRFEMKIFDASLNPTASTIFGANDWGEPSRALMEPKIALLSSGFMVTFRIGNCGRTWSCHAAQIFDASLNPVGTWFYVDGRVRGGDEISEAVLNLNGGPWSGHVVTSVSLRNGNVMLIHSGMNAATAGTTSASIWDASGNIVNAHFLIPDAIANRAHQSDHYADAALLSNGNVVVAWTRYQRENADGTGRDQRQLLFQILDQDGNKIGSNQRTWGPVESTGDATITVGGYVMVASTQGKFTISSNPGYNVYTRTFLNDGSINGAVVNELEGLASSLASGAVIEYGSQNYVIAVKGGRIDNIADAQDGVFLIGKTCADSTMSPTFTPTAEPPSAQCGDISGCYTHNFVDSRFSVLEPIDQSMCVYRIKNALKTVGTSGLSPSNPTHLRYFVDLNGDNQLEMGFLDENTLTWGADSISRVTTNNGGIQLKTTLNWSNGGIYIDSGYENIEGCGVSSSPTLMPTMEPISPTSQICEKQGQCVNSNNGAVFATMTARHLMTKAECITAFESCNDAAGASFRQSTNTCQIFGDGGLPTCAVVNGWQPGNVFDRSTGPITSTTGTASPWIDVTCFSPDLCAPPVCEMQGQCQNSNHNAIFATMTGHSMTKEECIQAYQACGDAAGASWRSSSSTCQIFGDGGIPKCAAVNGMQPGNVGDQSTGPITSTTGTATPWIDVTCFSPDLCDAVVKMEIEVSGWTQAQFTANKDAFTATLATSLGLSPSQVQASLRTLGWLRRNLDGGLSIYVRIKAQDGDMSSINSQLANPSGLTSDLNTQFPGAQFTVASSDVKTVAQAQSMVSSCPAGSVQKTGFSTDASWVLYTNGIDECKQACDLQSPVPTGQSARPCTAFMYSPTVTAPGGEGQCWRFDNADPEFTTTQGDYTFCVKTDVKAQVLDSGSECGPSNVINTEEECRNYAASLGIQFSWVGILHAPAGCFWHHNTGMSGSEITNIGFNSDPAALGSGWGGVGRVCKDDDVFISNQDSCPAQSEHLTLVDCKAAAEKLGIHYWGSNPAAPRGCWRFINPVNGATYVFGNANDGNNIQPADISPICRKTNDPGSSVFSLLGAGRCKSNGNIVPLSAYTLHTPKSKCISDCEMNRNCVAAMPAYDYYCQLFMKSDVAFVDDFAANYQTQWECYAKLTPDKIVTMQIKAQGMTSAGFYAQKQDLATSLASSLGVSAGQVELSLTPFQRRALSGEGLDIYARIEAMESDMQLISEKTSDLDTLAQELSDSMEGMTFEVGKSEVQTTDILTKEPTEESTSNPSDIPTKEPTEESTSNPSGLAETISETETKSRGVSTEVFVVVAFACVLLGLAIAFLIQWLSNSSKDDDTDLENGAKRQPGPTPLPALKKEISLQDLHVVDVPSGSFGGNTTELGEGKESLHL